MSTSSDSSPVNGHASPHADEYADQAPNSDQSDSDLSEVQPVDADVADATAQNPALAGEDSSGSSDNDASDDADFDMADSPVSPRSNDGNARTVLESRPAPKRKATQQIEDDFMRENPELYGLRRSVRFTYHCTPNQLEYPADTYSSHAQHNGGKL